MAAGPACSTKGCEPLEALPSVAFPRDAPGLRKSVILRVAGGGLGAVAGGPWVGGGVGVAPVASGTEVSGGGVGVEVAGTEVSGAALEEVFFFFFFSRTGGTEGSARPAGSFPAPMLLAPVSWVSGGEAKSSSARGSGGVGAARPELVVPPRGEAEVLPAPDGAGLE